MDVIAKSAQGTKLGGAGVAEWEIDDKTTSLPFRSPCSTIKPHMLLGVGAGVEEKLWKQSNILATKNHYKSSDRYLSQMGATSHTILYSWLFLNSTESNFSTTIERQNAGFCRLF